MMEEQQRLLELTAFERRAVEAAIFGHSQFSAFTAQLESASVISRTPSGVGFVTKLKVPEQLSIPEGGKIDALPAIQAEHPALPSGAEFVFELKGGRLHCIEAYCFEGMWPANESLFRLLPKS